MDAFHAQKWTARETPPAAASASSLAVTLLQSLHSPVATRNAPTIRSEKARRHTAIAMGSAFDSRTRGPANAIPSRASARTQYGFLDMTKKKSRCAWHRLFFPENLSPSSVF